MSTILYVNNCTTCGVAAWHIQRFKRYNPKAEVINTKYDAVAREDHVGYLKLAGMPTDRLTNIIVTGDDIMRLDEWTPSR